MGSENLFVLDAIFFVVMVGPVLKKANPPQKLGKEGQG